ncbi:MAG: hypothetical protein BWX70_02183 [Verrucomicrobia bacterium ADurb.Bin070]|nr:MAG: hypothetical protein BWX70_02183 [Verrucomicrobia bacterium ADurb.Bin070]
MKLMTTSFSTFRSPIWPHFKSASKDRCERAFFDVEGRIWRATPYVTNPRVDPDMVYTSIYATYVWKYCRITHFFLSNGVAEFCESAVREPTSEYAKALPSCDSIPVAGKVFTPWAVVCDADGAIPGAFAIHFPASSKRRSIIAIPSISIPQKEKAGDGIRGRTHYWFGADDGEDVVLCLKDNTGINWCDSAMSMVKTIYGLALYLDAFPETAKKATRDDVKDIAHYDGSVFTVAANESAREDAERSISPHFRRGHFRMLTSEVFKRKRGQVVFVRGSFVRGHALDVGPDLATDNASQLQNTSHTREPNS